MKKYIFLGLLIMAVVFWLVAPLGAFLTYGIWSTNQPRDWGRPYPEGTQIVRHTDTHRGFFRREGIAVLVAQIPKDHIEKFGAKLLTLRNEEFSKGPPVSRARDLLATVEEVENIIDSQNTLFHYDDDALALVEEPFSDCSAAIYDLDTGLFCYIEYDE